MTDPRTAALRFLAAMELGGLLGLWYGFLRPLRPRFGAAADTLFVLGTLGAWVYLAFALCRGDPRFGYLLGMLAGGLLWEMTIGRPLRRCFSKFWNFLGRIWAYFWFPWKFFYKKVKNMFASAEKWVTIRWNNRRHFRRRNGGGRHGRKEKTLQRRAGGLPPEQAVDQSGRDCSYRIVYCSADHSALDPE